MTTATVLWHESSFHSSLPPVTLFLPDHCAVISLLYIVNLNFMSSRNNVSRELSVMLPCLLAWQFDMDVSSQKNALFSWTLRHWNLSRFISGIVLHNVFRITCYTTQICNRRPFQGWFHVGYYCGTVHCHVCWIKTLSVNFGQVCLVQLCSRQLMTDICSWPSSQAARRLRMCLAFRHLFIRVVFFPYLLARDVFDKDFLSWYFRHRLLWHSILVGVFSWRHG